MTSRGLSRRVSAVTRTLLGTRSDWRLARPTFSRPRPSVGWCGPALVIGSVALSWFAFDSAQGRGSVAFGLFVGASSILLMAVEGPYGRFRPLAGSGTRLWVAGGVGITPFLAAVASLCHEAALAPRNRSATDGPEPPTLAYCVRSRADAMALAELERAATGGIIRLSLHVSDEGTRLEPATLAALVGRTDLRGVHVSVCGPAALVSAVERAAREASASSVHSEDFDIRQGVGPDLSVEIDRVVRGRVRSR